MTIEKIQNQMMKDNIPKPLTKEDGEKSFDKIKESLFNDPIIKAFLTSTTFDESVDEQKDVLTFYFHDTHCITIVKYSDYCFFVQEMGEEDSCWDHESFALPKYWDWDALEIIIRNIANRFKDHVIFDLYYCKTKKLKHTTEMTKWKKVPDYSQNLDDIIYDVNDFPRNYKELKIPQSNDNVNYALVVSGVENPNENMIPLRLGKDVFSNFYN